MEMSSWLSILVAHLLRCTRTVEIAVDRVTPEDIQKVHGFTTALLWTFSRDYFNKYNKLIPRTSLESELVAYNSGTWLLEISADEATDFIDWIYTIPEEDFNFDEATGYIRKMLEQTRVQFKLQEAALDDTLDVNELAATLTSGMEAASVGGAIVINPLEDAMTRMGDLPPDPIGGAEVNYFNILCQGGLRRGEIAVVLGPSGGFKTTMAIDICCAMAHTQEHSMYITYEQSFDDGDLPTRILARMADIDKGRIETTAFADSTLEEQKRIQHAMTQSHYLQFLDRSTHEDRVSDIAAFVQQQDRIGKKPRLVIIDQLLPWLDMWDDVTHENVRIVGRKVINELKQKVASKHGVAVVVLHQLSANLAGGSATRIPHHTDSQECKSICNWADFGIPMGNLHDELGILWVAASKTRRGSATNLLIRPDGGKCHLKLCEDYELSGDNNSGKFVPTGAASNMISPTTKKSTQAAPPMLQPGDL